MLTTHKLKTVALAHRGLLSLVFTILVQTKTATQTSLMEYKMKGRVHFCVPESEIESFITTHAALPLGSL